MNIDRTVNVPISFCYDDFYYNNNQDPYNFIYIGRRRARMVINSNVFIVSITIELPRQRRDHRVKRD